MTLTFNCLCCGRLNPIRGANYSNKYCNNKCQQTHRKELLNQKRIHDWQIGCSLYVWRDVPEYIKEYLIGVRGNICANCKNKTWLNNPIPLLVRQCDGDEYNNKEDNLELVCLNCHATK